MYGETYNWLASYVRLLGTPFYSHGLKLLNKVLFRGRCICGETLLLHLVDYSVNLMINIYLH